MDATPLRLADTPENQERFPQSSEQAPGCGFPLLKVLALFCLNSGAALHFVTAKQRAHDTPLASRLWRHLRPRDILLGDRAFSDFASLASLVRLGIDVVARLHQGRSPDFRRPAKRLGPDDACFVWDKPIQRPGWFSRLRWNRLPQQIMVRVVRSEVRRPGFRTRRALIVTTLLDPEAYPAIEIARAYLLRWRIELSFRDIKTTMQMEELRARTPAMAIKELLAALIAYNLVRITMVEASRRHPCDLHRLSFKGTIDALRQYCPRMAQARSHAALVRLQRNLYRSVALDPVPLRPGRTEPRAVKRRPKPFARLDKPRHRYRTAPHRNRWKPKPLGQSTSANAH